jgi:hypothetical protein
MKRLIIILYFALLPASAFAFIPLLFAGGAAVSLLPMMFFGAKVAIVAAYWPLAVAVGGFYYFVKIMEILAKKKTYEMAGSAGIYLRWMFISCYLILGVSFVSLCYHYDVHVVLIELWEQNA